MRTAIVYDRVNKWGGAERVLLALHRIFPDAPLYASVYDRKQAGWARAFPKVYTSFLQNFPFAKSNHEFLAPLMPFAFESFDFSGYDLVISVTSEAAKGIKTGPNTIHLCYCLTPTRYLWSGYGDYFRNITFKVLTRPIVGYLRRWDKIAARRPDVMIAISKTVQERISKYYKRNAEIIYPPVDATVLRISVARPGKYYLIVGRLDYGYKKVDLAIEAFNRLGASLVIVGTGRDEKRLKFKYRYRKNIKFAGKVTENELIKYYQGAKALIMPQEEDFGLVAVEAQTFGTPVIAYAKGGSLDTVIDGKTGILFKPQNEEALIRAIAKYEKMSFNHNYIKKNAQRFSFEVFQKRLQKALVRANSGRRGGNQALAEKPQ